MNVYSFIDENNLEHTVSFTRLEDSILLNIYNSHILVLEKLKDLSFDYYICSDLKRAVVTGKKILALLDIKDDKNEHPN